MTQKTKTSILITIILLITVGVGMYFFQKNKTTQLPQPIAVTDDIQQTQSAKNEQTQSPEEVAQLKYPTEIKGKVVGMTSKSLIIDRPEGALEVGININTPVTSAQDKKSIFDIVAGTTVIAQLDQASGEVKTINMEK